MAFWLTPFILLSSINPGIVHSRMKVAAVALIDEYHTSTARRARQQIAQRLFCPYYRGGRDRCGKFDGSRDT